MSQLLHVPQRLCRAREEYGQFESWWEQQGCRLVPKAVARERARGYIERWWRYDIRDMGHLIRIMVGSKFESLAAAKQLMEQIMRNTTSWSEQLITLRTIQTLSILDIESSKHIVRNLGEYEDAEDEATTVRIPTL